jgi:hypothetical protein
MRSDRPYPAPDDEPESAGQECARDQWCSARIITFVDGERIVTPAQSPRPYCDRCATFLADCAKDLPGYWVRLAAAIGDPLVAEVQIHSPFGPQVILREDVESHMAFMAFTLGGWAARVRSVPGLSLSPLGHPHGSAKGVRDNARVLARHITPLIALQDAWMTRQVFMPPMPRDEDMRALGTDWLPSADVLPPREPAEPIPADLVEEFGDRELIRVTIDSLQPQVLAGGEDAGRDIQWLHYRSRSLLLETNPPPELLIVPCRQCTWRSLRRAWPDSERDLYSRCDNCQDEMDWPEYEINAKRWVAYHRAHATPVLADAPDAVLA